MQKRWFSTLILTFALFKLEAHGATDNTQTLPLKIGYTNIEYILSFLPEAKKIESEYTSFERQLKNQLETKVAEFQQKVQDFQQGYEAMTEAAINKKQLELQELQKSFERLQLESQEKLANKHTSLLKPVDEKIRNMIAKVAKEYGYTHIFNSGTGIPVLLYVDEEHNISKEVLKRLGVNLQEKKQNEDKTNTSNK